MTMERKGQGFAIVAPNTPEHIKTLEEFATAAKDHNLANTKATKVALSEVLRIPDNRVGIAVTVPNMYPRQVRHLHEVRKFATTRLLWPIVVEEAEIIEIINGVERIAA